jgi:hypothetical protein
MERCSTVNSSSNHGTRGAASGVKATCEVGLGLSLSCPFPEACGGVPDTLIGETSHFAMSGSAS